MVSLAVNFWRHVITAELWRPEVTRPENVLSNYCVFWKKFQNSVPTVYMATPIDVIVLKCRKNLSDWKSAKPCVIYLIKKTISLAPCQIVASAWIVPKICQDYPQTFSSHCSRFHPNQFTFGGVIAERVKAVLWAHWVNSLFARSEASLRANNYFKVFLLNN